MQTEVDSLKAIASRRFIFARWFFLFAGILFVGYREVVVGNAEIFSNSATGPIVGLLFMVAMLNILYLLFSNIASKKSSYFLSTILNIGQLGLDFLLVAFLVAVFPNASPFIGLLFILPTIEAILLFDSAIALVISLLGAGVLWGWSYLPASEIKLLSGLFSLPVFGMSDLMREYSIYTAGLIILFVVFWSYFTDLIRIRQVNRSLDHKLEDIPVLSTRQTQTEWARGFGRKMEENSRLLRSKEIELTLAKEQLETLENAKSEFISVTTHELRTPLSAIKWTFNMIMSEQLGPINTEQKEFLSKGYQSTLKMIGIVNNLVHIDHATAKKEDYSFVATDIVSLIDNAIAEFSNQAISKKINLSFSKMVTNLPLIEIDKNKISMVMENLIDNAIKYTPKEGKITVTVTDSRLNSAQPALEISVIDNGVGIPKDEQEKIFHKFFRASNARLAEPDGSGIGLYIAKDIVDRHFGSMWFKSEEGKGTAFHIVLPVHQLNKNVV
ncbi:MAG: hypothetical protein A2571_02395 [Candidatus Vogelbacteria bacterium RIFOXYD1_FULL_44_32]|uniref:histidine kinase n=1 Tax=Candidatus Vogelbacteria bacterium RIFOXYD1_FULL_44_32 TaxID=1802438 RepID=A0A1G2QDK8_9BACT|nr:MAG: hypothetical protein A2571_02395 [Candidatus Vogelbacteria bacterium RIFOXYD1_FULL_44_32]